MVTILLAVLACLPSAIIGFFIWLLQRRIAKSEKTREAKEMEAEKKREESERAREKNEMYIIKAVGASLTLGEATARAVQRIPDAHCNGDMSSALDYADKVKKEQKDFLTEQAIRGLY